MVGVVLISENSEGHEMLKTARRLLGRIKRVTSIVLKPGRSVSQMQASLRRAIGRVDQKGGVLLLTDFYGSTQCNVCMKFLKAGAVELVTGFNLPMLVKIGTIHESYSLRKLITFIEKYGKEQIRHVSRR